MWSKWRCGRFSRNRLSANLSDFVGALGQHRASYGDEWSSGVFHLCHNEVVFHFAPRLARSPSLSGGCSQHQQCSVPQIDKSTRLHTFVKWYKMIQARLEVWSIYFLLIAALLECHPKQPGNSWALAHWQSIIAQLGLHTRRLMRVIHWFESAIWCMFLHDPSCMSSKQ